MRPRQVPLGLLIQSSTSNLTTHARWLASCRIIHTDGRQHSNSNRFKNTSTFTTFGLVSLATTFTAYKTLQAYSKGGEDDKQKYRNTKVISLAEVRKHDSLDKGVWITYRGSVYDVTDFVRHHPGGTHTILMGAGGDVEPFWKTYTVHEAREVQVLLAKYKIGTLSDEDRKQVEHIQTSEAVDGPYSNDPIRNSLLQVLTQQPFNAESPGKLLTTTPVTPNEIFFVRNHLPVPEVDLSDYSLTICNGTDKDPDKQEVLAEFTLNDLKTKFKPHTVESVVQCSGNRRSDLKKIKEIKGLNWGVGAIGNAQWTGVKLTDLLQSIDCKIDSSIKHVQLEGLDHDVSGQNYGASISADVAFDPNRDVLLAYEMNGKPLSRDHGFPLRFIAPGITGARNVKWLSKIILSHEESNSHWQRNDYKSFSPSVDMFSIDYKQAISIQEMPVQSAVCDPNDGEMLSYNIREGDRLIVPVKGYAYSGGGKRIVRVDVSTDGGDSWMTAELIDSPRDENGDLDFTNRNQVWSWTRWSIDVPIPERLLKSKGQGSLDILCRAFDSAYNSQPERAETVWNVRGVVNNSWHKIRVDVTIK